MSTYKTIVITANTSWYVYNFRRNTICELISCGFKVAIVAPRDEYSEKLVSLGCKYQNVFIDQGGVNPFNDIKTFFLFYRIFKEVRPCCVLNFTPKNNIYASIATGFLGVPTINNIAGLGSVFRGVSVVSLLVKVLYRLSHRKVNVVFFQNTDDQNLFKQYNILSGNTKTIRIPGSGVDLTRFKVSHNASEVLVLKFIFVGRLLLDKGVGLYVDAARILKSKYGGRLEFSVLGFLDLNKPSSVTAEQLGAWVSEGVITYLGSSDEVERTVCKIDCVVLPSYYGEGVPKSLLEAAAMGKLIVTTDSVGCREVVDHGVNGYLAKPKSLDSLIESIEKVIGLSGEERVLMGNNGRVKVESEFNEKIVISRYLSEISALVGREV